MMNVEQLSEEAMEASAAHCELAQIVGLPYDNDDWDLLISKVMELKAQVIAETTQVSI